MKDISFLIPSIRNYNDTTKYVVNSINDFMLNTDYKYEIIISSPYQPPEELNCKWVRDYERKGTVNGYNITIPHIEGNYIYILNDKWIVNKKILKAIDFLESNIYKNRRFKATTINAPANLDYRVTAMPMIGSESAPHLNLPKELMHSRFLDQPYKYPIFGFPVISKDTLKNHLCNHICNPRFINHYHDNWLSFYIGEMGEYPWVCENTQMTCLPYPTTSTTDNYDYQVFCSLAQDLINKRNLDYV